MFAIVIPTYQRKNGLTPNYIQNISQMLAQQTYQNFRVFLIGDNYENNLEFQRLTNLFPRDKIFAYNNNKSYRQGYFQHAANKWCIGGVMAIKIGVEQDYKEGFKYYLHLDDDDSWTANKLEKVAEIVTQFPEAEFLFHASVYFDKILPEEHSIKTYFPLSYNNLLPRSSNIVHSSNILSLKCYDIFMNYTLSIMEIAEKIKEGKIAEYNLSPFDAELINVILNAKLKCIYIPEILSIK